MKKIDVHCHYYPGSYLKELAKLGVSSVVGQQFSRVRWESEEKFISEMDGYGIDVAVLGVSSPNVYFDDKELSLALAQITNDELSEICRKYPNRFGCLASVPLVDMKYALDELSRAVDKLGMDGVFLGTDINGKPLESEEFLPLFEVINKKGIPVFLHPGGPRGIEFMKDYDTAPMIGYVFDTTLTVTNMVLSGLFEKYPDIKMVLSHLGGAIPFLAGRIDLIFRSHEVTRKTIGHTGKLPSDYLKRLYYDTTLSHWPSVLCTYQFVGADHILFGSDFPFTRGFRVPFGIDVIDKSNLTTENKEKIFSQNAIKLIPRLGETT